MYKVFAFDTFDCHYFQYLQRNGTLIEPMLTFFESKIWDNWDNSLK